MHRIEVLTRTPELDRHGERLAKQIRSELGLEVEQMRVGKVYYLSESLDPAEAERVASDLLIDPIVEQATLGTVSLPGFDWSIEVGYRPGVTDNEARTAEQTIEFARRAGRVHADGPVQVHTSRRYFVAGSVEGDELERMADQLLANALVQRVRVTRGMAAAETVSWGFVPEVRPPAEAYQVVELPDSDDDLVAISRKGLLSLTRDEMRAIRGYFADPTVQEGRIRLGLPAWPTDVELEAIAQTWSEHCKHKIFNDRIRYREGDREELIEGLFKTYIRGSTERVATERDWLVSVFTDNAGVIKWNATHHLVFKAETHNAPSALEPYGGALTGIVGVNRDPAGTGLGAHLLFNTDVFCFADPAWSKPLPPGVLHPARIFAGVRRGVEDGGNQSGIPTVNGALFFDDRYLGRPLVFCGTGALMPVETAGRPGHDKEVLPSDLIVMAGGRVGKDGIHGATFSSAATGAEAPVGVVQIGDPITQKQLLDMLAEARSLGLYRAITDNGAGGLSSSVGEMAELAGGARLDLDRVPLKYPGLAPWEVLVSESQERMTLAVDLRDWPALQDLAERRGVEVSAIGEFTAGPRLEASWHGQPVMALDMAFLHGGLPKRTLEAEWTPRPPAGLMPPMPADLTAELKRLLGSLNICSRESVIRQYDHEVQGGSVVKPLVGIANDGPSDAAVVRPLLDSDEGVAVSCAINPHYGDHDAYAMATLMVDEALRNAVAVGADPDHTAMLDNFCWPDPVFDPLKNPDGRFKLSQLVRANRGLYDATIAYGTPLISGKDSVKNDYHGPDGKISVPPTLLVSAIAKHPDIRKAVTMDVKAPGDLVYLLGETRAELGGSQYARQLGWEGGTVPAVEFDSARKRYRSVFRAIAAEWITACHDCSEGGLAVALAEMAFAGGFGLSIRLDDRAGLRADELLFSESASRLIVTVPPDCRSDFEALFTGQPCASIGMVLEAPRLVVELEGRPVVQAVLEDLKAAWQGGLSA